jgi:EAL domain-containing protein (putative c-di-GMP-specific phosphodiesterase class I)
MARSLGLGVIAEGVETQEQLDLLAQEGCNLYQGFLCSRPVDAAALAVLVKEQQAG